MRAAVLLALACACPAPAAAPSASATTGSATAPPDAASPPADAREPTQDEKLAAIQQAMNVLDEGVQGCWAAAAARDRFDIAGTVKVQVDIAARTGGAIDRAHPSGRAQLVEDTTRNASLTSCVLALLETFPWAPPLFGQSIQLPFRVTAPLDGQNVIDRALVPWAGQGDISVAVLLDAANSGNDELSLFEVAVRGGGSTGMRVADRAELWYFLGPATVRAVGTGGGAVAAGDMAYVPAGSARAIDATAGDVHAVLAMVPGGREGSGRAGALPTRELSAVRSAPVGATLLPAAAAKTYGPATIFLDATIAKGAPLAASILTLPAGAQVAEHVHAKETEALYVLAGSGTMTVAGTQLAVGATSVVQVPANTKHAVTAAATLRAVQFYTPAGPEQRFKKAAP